MIQAAVPPGRCTAFAIVLALWLAATRSSAQVVPSPPSTPPAPFDNLAAVAPFAESFAREGLARHHVAGASIAVVADGHIVSSSVGVADPATGARLEPSTSRFHIASVTKLITAIAVMQQVEAGALDLDASVAGYLEPALQHVSGGQTVRVRDLLTHTAGYADRWVGMSATRAEDVWPLSTYLDRRAAPVVDAPGSVPRYSNYGYALAGHLVERVSGVPFAAYVRDRIFAPLGATRSYVGPRAPDRDDAMGFFYRDTITAEPRVFEHTVPAGGVHATVPDLARIVGAVLSDGSFDGVRVLSAESALAIRSAQFTPHQGLAGWGFGLYERAGWNDEAWIAGGEVPGISTRALLVPARGLAIVIAVNRKDPSLASALFDAVMSRLPPGPARARRTPPGIVDDRPGAVHEGAGVRLEGRYRLALGDPSSFLAFASLFVPSLTLTPRDAHTLNVVFANAGRPSELWHVASDDALLDATGRAVAAVRRDAVGRPTHILVWDHDAGLVTFARTPWWDAPELTLLILLAALGTSVVTLAVLALSWAGRGRHRASASATATGDAVPASTGTNSPSRPAGLVAAMTVVFLVAFSIGLAQMAIVHDDRFAFGVPLWFRGVLWMPVALACAWLWLVARLRRWRATGVGPWSRMGYIWLATVTLAALAVMVHWNLFGARL